MAMLDHCLMPLFVFVLISEFVPLSEYDWEYSVYGKVEEQIPSDAPTPLGKEVITITFLDANLYHDLLTGRATTGILHFVNKTPIDWFTKRQATVETTVIGRSFFNEHDVVDEK